MPRKIHPERIAEKIEPTRSGFASELVGMRAVVIEVRNGADLEKHSERRSMPTKTHEKKPNYKEPITWLKNLHLVRQLSSGDE